MKSCLSSPTARFTTAHDELIPEMRDKNMTFYVCSAAYVERHGIEITLCIQGELCFQNAREYAEQLKTSRDELAAASTQDDNGGALSSAEKRSLLAQKASIERMATETRRYGLVHTWGTFEFVWSLCQAGSTARYRGMYTFASADCTRCHLWFLWRTMVPAALIPPSH